MNDEPVKSLVNGALDAAAGHLAQGDMDAARSTLLAALHANGPNVALLLRLVEIENTDDERDKALDHARRACELEPDNPDAISTLAWQLRYMSRYRDALSPLTDRPDDVRGNPLVRAELGLLYSDMGWKGKAVAAFGSPKDLGRDARRARLRSWYLSGGPFGFIRTRVTRLNNKMQELWEEWTEYQPTLTSFEHIPKPTLVATGVELDTYVLAWAKRVSWRSGKLTDVSSIIFGLVAAWAVIFFGIHLLWPHTTTSTAIVLNIVGTLGAIVILVGGSLIAHYSVALRINLPVIVAGEIVLISTGVTLVINRPVSSWTPWGLVGLTFLAASAGSLSVGVIFNGGFYLARFDHARMQAIRARTAIIDHLIEVLHSLSTEGKRNDLSERRHWIWDIEGAATLAKNRLCKTYPYRDPVTDAWAVERAAGATTAIRNLKRLIAAPYPRGWERLEVAARASMRTRSTSAGADIACAGSGPVRNTTSSVASARAATPPRYPRTIPAAQLPALGHTLFRAAPTLRLPRCGGQGRADGVFADRLALLVRVRP